MAVAWRTSIFNPRKVHSKYFRTRKIKQNLKNPQVSLFQTMYFGWKLSCRSYSFWFWINFKKNYGLADESLNCSYLCLFILCTYFENALSMLSEREMICLFKMVLSWNFFIFSCLSVWIKFQKIFTTKWVSIENSVFETDFILYISAKKTSPFFSYLRDGWTTPSSSLLFKFDYSKAPIQSAALK